MAARKTTDPEKQTDAAAEQVQDAVDVETSQGYRGEEVDPTPNENYTVAGVTSGKPTPETDEKQAAKAAEAASAARSRFTEK
ncbi:MAG TPA: hypothetical protein VFV66_02910 [Nonomuraea sp.]|nr:hypothetical protein [Nonomuraea sp.]